MRRVSDRHMRKRKMAKAHDTKSTVEECGYKIGGRMNQFRGIDISTIFRGLKEEGAKKRHGRRARSL